MVFAHDNLHIMPEKGKEARLYNKVLGFKWSFLSTGYILSHDIKHSYLWMISGLSMIVTRIMMQKSRQGKAGQTDCVSEN